MSKYFICCEDCFTTIGKKNTNAAKLWMDLCAMHLDLGTIVVSHTFDSIEIRVLENLGFLISTDQQEEIHVKLNGHMNTEEGEHFFCVQEGQHD